MPLKSLRSAWMTPHGFADGVPPAGHFHSLHALAPPKNTRNQGKTVYKQLGGAAGWQTQLRVQRPSSELRYKEISAAASPDLEGGGVSLAQLI